MALVESESLARLEPVNSPIDGVVGGENRYRFGRSLEHALFGSQHGRGAEQFTVSPPVDTGDDGGQCTWKGNRFHRCQRHGLIAQGALQYRLVGLLSVGVGVESVALQRRRHRSVQVRLTKPCPLADDPVDGLVGDQIGVLSPVELWPLRLSTNTFRERVHGLRSGDPLGFGAPGRAHVRQRLGGLFRIPCGQDRGLPQLVALPTTRGLLSACRMFGSQSIINGPRLDAALGKPVEQASIDTGDFPHRFGPGRARMGLELQAHLPGKKILQRYVVAGRNAVAHLEDRRAIQRPPFAVLALHLVGHQHMRMQVRVPGAGVEMGELGGDQTARCDLLDTVGAAPRERCVLLCPLERFGYRSVVK